MYVELDGLHLKQVLSQNSFAEGRKINIIFIIMWRMREDTIMRIAYVDHPNNPPAPEIATELKMMSSVCFVVN